MSWAEVRRRAQARPLVHAVNLNHKLGLPDYSSVEASMHISGITASATDADVEALVAKGKVAWAIMGPAVTRQVQNAREKKGW